MSYTTTQLINEAYYASGIVAREFETVSGGESGDGLGWLNDIIGDKAIDSGMVPYESDYELNFVEGVETYFIPNLISIDTLTFVLQTVRYSMQYTQRNQYFGSSRVNQIQSLPFQWYFERKVGGGNLHIYFQPDQTYPATIHGIFRLPEVSLGQDLMSSVAKVNLGFVTVTGAGLIGANELVVNDVDLAGTYANAAALNTYINTGVIPNVTSTLYLNELILTNTANGGEIELYTLGTESSSNHVTFYNFSTVDSVEKQQTYFPMKLDRFYITYLKYALAERICAEYNQVVPPGVSKELGKYQAFIDKQSRLLDLKLEKSSTLQDRAGLNWAMVNLGRGFVVPY